MPNRIFLLDTMSFIYRAYHAANRQPFAMTTKTGFPTGATYIFCRMLRKLMEDNSPEYMVAICDMPGETIRDREFADYKANRKGETPLDLVKQLPKIFQSIEAYGLPVMKLAGYEADDLIGTLAKAAYASDPDCQIFIVSGDKDMFQLVNDRTFIINPMKELLADAAKVVEIVGVPPEQVTDVMALRGDTVDNIPGAPGIGDKGSVDIIKKFGSVEEAIKRADEITRKSYRESLQNNAFTIMLSKRLVTIRTDAPVALDFNGMRIQPQNTEVITALYKELEFASLLKKEQLGTMADFAEIVAPVAEFKQPEAMSETEADSILDSLF